MILVQPSKDWPKQPRQVFMRTVTNRDGFKVFTFEEEKEYKMIQSEFRSIQASMDIQQLMHFLERNPYHHETLLSMADFFRMQGQFPESAKLIRRCIFAFEKSFSHEFKILGDVPQTRLNFDHPDN